MEISIGIMVIGSLWWDDSRERTQWRRERLELNAPSRVRVPIRYGRRSQSRGNSYTMVFSRGLAHDEGKLGTALFVPCRRRVQSKQQLVEEAEFLWTAERNADTSNGRISANWGCVALAVNPARSIPEELLEYWASRVSQEQGYGDLSYADDEEGIVGASGLLNIPWPQRMDAASLQADALLATVTNPTIQEGRYPTPKDIASTWITDSGDRYVEYFWKNREHKILTFQDSEIERLLDGEPA